MSQVDPLVAWMLHEWIRSAVALTAAAALGWASPRLILHFVRR